MIMMAVDYYQEDQITNELCLNKLCGGGGGGGDWQKKQVDLVVIFIAIKKLKSIEN